MKFARLCLLDVKKRLEMRTDGDAFPTKFLEVTTADHHVSIEDNE